MLTSSAQIALLSQTPQLSAAQSAKITRQAINALVGAALLAGALAPPADAQFIGGAGSGGGGVGGLTGITALGNTINSSSGAPAASQLSFSGTDGASVGLSGGTVLISAPAGAGTSFNASVIGNTTGATSSQTGTITAQVTSGAGGVSIGFSNGTAIISGPLASATGLAGVALGNTTGATSSSVLTLTGISLSGAGGASIGFSTTGAGAGVIIVSGATTAASGTANSVVLAGNTTALSSSGVVTLGSMSISGAGGNSVGMSNGTLVISGATGGAGGGGSIYQEVLPANMFLTQTVVFSSIVSAQFSTSSIDTNQWPQNLYVQPFNVNQSLVMNQIDLIWSSFNPITASRASTSVSSSGSASASMGISLSIFSHGTAVGQYSSVTSASVLFSESQTVSLSSSSKTNAASVTFPNSTGNATSTGSATFSISTATGAAGVPAFSDFSNVTYLGTQILKIPLATTLPPAQYAIGISMAGAGSNNFTVGGQGFSGSLIGFSNPGYGAVLPIGVGNLGTNGTQQLLGYGAVSTSAQPVATYNVSLVTSGLSKFFAPILHLMQSS